jgi:hypothetical protein
MHINWDIICTWVIISTPALLYLWIYLSYLQIVKNKRFELRRVLTRASVMNKYCEAYGNKVEAPNEVAARILLRNNYAIVSYLSAFAFTALLTTMVAVIAVVKGGLPTGLPNSLANLITGLPGIPAVLAGCAGAFVWGLYELLRRYRVGDLTPSTIYLTGLRLLVIAGVGPALSIVLNKDFTYAIAFGLGVFSLEAIASIASLPVRNALNLPAATVAVSDPMFAYVQGLTPEIISRLDEAGIQTLQQLAFTDPLRLLVRTNLDWKVIIDLVDQAFLATYVGKKTEELRSIGIRGAVEFSCVDDELPPLIASIAKILERQPQDIELLINTFRGDPTTKFIGELWS